MEVNKDPSAPWTAPLPERHTPACLKRPPGGHATRGLSKSAIA